MRSRSPAFLRRAVRPEADRRWRALAPRVVLSVSALFALGAGVPRLDAPLGLGWIGPSRRVAETVRTSPPRVIESSFVSPSLGRAMAYAVFLPPGYDAAPSAHYPVLYMLHGLGGDHTQWMNEGLLTTAADLMQRGEIPPFIIVLPDGERGYWIDHANDGPRFGSYVTQDLVGTVDRTFRTEATRDARAIGGMSMGGHGALQLALNSPETFRVVGAHSVALRTKEQAFEFFGDARYFEAHDPVSLVRHRTDVARQLVISIDIGAHDPWEGAAEAFHRGLTSSGVVHQWSVAEGGHDDVYWRAHVADYLRFYGRSFQVGSSSSGE